MDRGPDDVPAERCRNCEAPVSGSFCSQCGQRTADPRRPLLAILREWIAETFELDGRLRRTLVPLLLRPGFLSREVRQGRRARYTSPLRLYIAASLLCFSTIALQQCIAGDEVFDDDRVVVVERSPPSPDASEAGDALDAVIDDHLAAFGALPQTEQKKRIAQGFTANMPKAFVLLVPVFAAILGLLVVRRGFLYVDHLVFALHVHALWFLLLTVGAVLPDDVDAVLVLPMAAYVLVAFRRAYELSWAAALWRAAIGSALYGAALVVALIGVLLATIVWS